MALGPIASWDVDRTAVPGASALRQDLTAASGSERPNVSVAIEELAPGGADGPARYRLFGEEHVFVLEGAPTLHVGAETHRLQPGAHACFPAGRRAAHRIVNAAETPCRYVVVGERLPHEITVLPGEGKAVVHALGPDALIDFQDEATDTPVPPRSSDAIEWNDEASTGANFGGRSKHLSYAALGPDYRIGLLIEQPAPGRRIAERHYHLLEEEHALILEGRVALILDDGERRELAPGGYVCFPAGEPVGHSLMNVGDGPCSTLMIGERRRFDCCVYPDSNKLLVSGLGGGDPVFDMSARRRYFDGEDLG